MTPYGPYNIVIHANPQYRRADFPFEPATGDAAERYEQRIRVTLNAISDFESGRALLSSLVSWVPVYIVPYRGGDCNAVTGQLTSDLMKGIRIQYSPETWAHDACGHWPGYRPMETLFHELVHASRFTSLGFVGLDKTPLKDMQDAEEFLAVMMTNVFRSEQGAKKLNRDYRTGALVSQLQLEFLLSSRNEYLKSLTSMRGDPLVSSVARLFMPFNPFRDLNRLKKIQSVPQVPSRTRLA